MKTRFYLEKRKDPEGRLMVKERPVLMSVTFNGERVMLGTDVRIDMNGWDPVVQRVKPGYPGAPVLNDRLDTLEDAARKTWKLMSSDGIELRAGDFRDNFRRVKPSFSSGFFQVFYEFLESGYNRWSMTTYRKVRTIYNHLREFQDRTGYALSFRSLDEAFLPKFIAFYVEKGNNHTTNRKAVNILVWFLNWATGNGYNIYTEYRKFYKMLEPEPAATAVKPLYLRWQEVMRLLDFQPGNRREERVRDQFCFMCLSGLRFSEIQSLRKEDIGEQEIIVGRNKGRKRILPMNRFTQEIYRNYNIRYYLDNAAFPSMSIITFNKYLRIIAKKAGLYREVHLPGTLLEPLPPVAVHEHLTAGIAVNTFIANALELEIPVDIISTFTGVKQDNRIHRIKAVLAKEEMKKFDEK